MYFTFPGVWILGNGPHEFPPNVEEIYGRDSQRDAKPQAGLLVCARLSNCTFPRLSVTSCWCFCLLWRPGQDVTAITTPNPTSAQTIGHTHTHTHKLPVTVYLRTGVCVCVCVYGIRWAKADSIIVRLHPIIFKYISHFSSVLFA